MKGDIGLFRGLCQARMAASINWGFLLRDAKSSFKRSVCDLLPSYLQQKPESWNIAVLQPQSNKEGKPE